ncbi:MAG: hypothetical protein QM820_01115 [Minicystis sp.]
MYAGVPANRPSSTVAPIVSRIDPPLGAPSIPAGPAAFASPPVRRAMPKSSTFTAPSSRTITFSGFTSRWTSPARCAAPSARATSTSHPSRVAAGTSACPT